MTLPSSGAISLNQMHTEVGGTSETTVSLNDADVRAMISKSSETQMSFNEWYGASSGGGGASVALTEVGYLNVQLSGNVTRSSYTKTYTVQNATVTSGKRHVIIAFTYRPLSLSGYTPTTWMGNCTLTFDGTTMDFLISAGSAFNATGIFEKTMDVGTGSKNIVLTFPVSTAGGEGSYSILILDNVNEVGGTSNSSFTSAGGTITRSLSNVSVGTTNFPSGYTHFLKLIASNTSNSSNTWTYSGGTGEGTYTLIGGGDNGSNERNSSYYRFASGTMSSNISGSVNGNSANSGAAIIGTARGFK
tara:strand:+ start:698 stop:1606 length:909 start_codon:yes stop_codon:yes gene_type:complete